MNSQDNKKIKTIAVIGASFNTGNLGVSALAWSAIKLIKTKWPNSRVILFGGRHPSVQKIQMDGKQDGVPTWPVRCCANMLAQNHIIRVGFAVILCRFLPLLKQSLSRNKTTLGELLRCDLIFDLTGGDSFSDIYGLSRFLRGYFFKRICQLTGKPYILLPQTYGPFKTLLARKLACRVLNNAEAIYSRDQEGIVTVKKLIGATNRLRLCPDVAFAMDPIRPDTAQTSHLEQLKIEGKRIVGLNISGLLYNGGYTRNNMFDLAGDYPTLVRDIISYFASQDDQHVLLVPHVLPSSELAVEDDLIAAKKTIKALPADIQNKVIILKSGYDQNETKYIISLCEFFIGARMHATIAALSQFIPAIGLAYSQKFRGVFESAGVADCVLDLRFLNNNEVLNGIEITYARRKKIQETLKDTMPNVKNLVFDVFSNLPKSEGN